MSPPRETVREDMGGALDSSPLLAANGKPITENRKA
jgi:hypothetical protein